MKIAFEGRDWNHVLQQMQNFMAGLQQQPPPAPAANLLSEARTEGGDTRRKFKVLLSPYADINPGETGVLVGMEAGGYALRFEKMFATAANPAEYTLQKRTIFFSEHQVEEIK